MIRRGARRHLRLGTSIGAGWDAEPCLQGGEWETWRSEKTYLFRKDFSFFATFASVLFYP